MCCCYVYCLWAPEALGGPQTSLQTSPTSSLCYNIVGWLVSSALVGFLNIEDQNIPSNKQIKQIQEFENQNFDIDLIFL